jgi:two-component system, NarL family, sensor kinase
MNVIFLGTTAMLFMALFIVLFVLYYQRRQDEQRIRIQDMEAEFQKKLLEVSMAATEAERRRIAQDLHDDIGALLSVTKLTVNSLHKRLLINVDAGNSRLIEQIRDTLDESVSNVRRISRELIPTTLEHFGLPAAIQEFAAKSSHSDNLRVTFEYDGEENRRLVARTELMLYRIAQELINNAIKHSGGTSVHIQTAYTTDKIQLIVQDNGVGFDLSTVQNRPNPGLGLDSIEGRLRIINGKIQYETAPERGCRAKVVLLAA